jgi:mannose-1-phosphate guanylyltransferase
LLAAGFGSRLRPLTLEVPKCLVPIRGKPVIQYWFEALDQAGVGEFLVNTHYLSDKVIDFINASEFKSRTVVVHETHLLGTAGTLMANIDFFKGEDGLLVHADNFTKTSMKDFVQAHSLRPENCDLTLLAFRTNTPKSCGVLEVNSRGAVIGFYEKVSAPPTNLASGAVFVLSSTLIEKFRQGHFAQAYDFSADVLPQLVGKIFAWETKEVFLDIGTEESYRYANTL